MTSPCRIFLSIFTCFLAACGSKEPSAPVTPPGPLVVKQVALRRDGDHVMIQATVDFTNGTGSAVRLRNEDVTLLAGSEIIGAFTRPFNEYPNIAPGTTGSAKLEYWAEVSQLGNELRLKYDAQRITIKSDGKFDIAQLPEGQLVFVSWPAWKTH